MIPRVHVDFNDVAEDGVLESTSGPIPPGTLVFLQDHEGNSCYGVVASHEHGLLRIAGKWRFWAPAKPPLSSAVNQASALKPHPDGWRIVVHGPKTGEAS